MTASNGLCQQIIINNGSKKWMNDGGMKITGSRQRQASFSDVMFKNEGVTVLVVKR